jgi:histone H3/H4
MAKDVELFAQHAGRKSIRMGDVILTGTWVNNVCTNFRKRRKILAF